MTFLNNFLSDFKLRYKKSLTDLTYRKYFKKSIAISLSVFVVSFMLSYFYHIRIYELSLVSKLSLSFIQSSTLTLISILFILIYPNYRVSVEKNRLENGLLYTVSYMTILANCGYSLDRMFTNSVNIEQNQTIKKLMTSFITDIKLLGYDIEQGIKRLMERSPSKVFSELLVSISNANWASGDLKQIMRYHFNVLDKNRKDETERMMNSLTVLSEVYVAIMVIAPIMFIIMIVLLSVLSSSISSISSITLLNSITFIFLPFTAAGFLVLLDTMKGGD